MEQERPGSGGGVFLYAEFGLKQYTFKKNYPKIFEIRSICT